MGLGFGIVPGTAAGGSEGTTVIKTIPYQSNTLMYQKGVTQEPEWANWDPQQLDLTGVVQGENANEYIAIFTPRTGHKWLDGSTDPKQAVWVINRAPISDNFVQSAAISYDGNEHTVSLTNFDSTTASISGDTATDAGTHIAVVTPDSNHCWSNGTYSAINVEWVIDPEEVAVPSVTNLNFTYVSGTSQGPTIGSYDSSKITVTGSRYTDAGNYTLTLALKDKTNNVWAGTNGSSTDRTFSWSIVKANGSVTLSATSGTVTYGTSKTFTVTGNTGSGELSVSSSNDNFVTASVSGNTVTVNIVEVNSATCTITVTSAETNNYNTATATYTVTSAKADGSVTLSATSGTVTYGTPGSFTVTGNTSGGALSVSSSNSTYVGASLSGTTVTVTVNEVNSETRTITVTSAATTNYNEATATYTVTSAKADGSVTLSATSGTVTYGTPGSFTVTGNTSGGELSVSSSASEYVSATISDTAVTVTTNKYRSSTVAIIVTSAETNNYNAATATYTVTTARATGTLSIDKTSFNLTTSAPNGTVTVTTNSNGTITATPANNAVCSAKVSGNTVTIKGKSNGKTTVTIAVEQSDQYTAPTSKTVTVTVPTAIPTSMTDDTTLAEIKTIFSSGQGANYFKAGDYFDITFPSAITLNSGSIAANSTWRVVCLGIDHNSSKEGTNRGHFCIGKTTDGKEICFYGHKMNSSNTNSGGWNGSAMKTWLNGTFYNALPTDLKNVITECTKYTDNTGGSSNTAANVTSTSQKIWLLAEFEVFGTRIGANQYEQNSQAQYDYYKNGNSKVRYQHASQDSAGVWWLRSTHCDFSGYFRFVSTNGGSDVSGAGYAYGVVPGFTIS